MSHDDQVWDLGDVDTPSTSGGAAAIRVAPAVRSRPQVARRVDWLSGLAIPLPGVPLVARGYPAEGLLFTVGIGLTASLGWAVFATLDRTGSTLEALGLPSAAAVWCLGGLVVAGALLHAVSVAWVPHRGNHAPPPAVSALASALVPGWGQRLNGDPLRAAALLAGAWVVAFAWALDSPFVGQWLVDQGLVLPPWLDTVSGAPFRAGSVAAVWSIAVYDAAQRAAWIRS